MAKVVNKLVEYIIDNLRSPCEECEDKKCGLLDGNECDAALYYQNVMSELRHRGIECIPPKAVLLRYKENIPLYNGKKSLFTEYNIHYTCSRCGREIMYRYDEERVNAYPITHCLCGAEFVEVEDI